MVSKSGTDFTGLGWWSWMWIRGKGRAEVGTNWSKMRKGKDLSTLFRTNTEAKTICGYNKHDNIERGQEGGTAIIALDSAATMVSKSGTDFTGLGWW